MTMTDKTSTAPVMSLQRVRELIVGLQRSVGDDNCARVHSTILRDIHLSIEANLSAPTPDVVGGDVVDIGALRLKLSSLVEEIQRPLEFKQAKEEYFRAGVRAAIVRAIAELDISAVESRAATRVQGGAWQSIDSVVAELPSDEAGKEAPLAGTKKPRRTKRPTSRKKCQPTGCLLPPPRQPRGWGWADEEL